MSQPDEPFARFHQVLTEAEAAGIEDPNAMVVSSVSAEGQPSSRVVLLKGFDERGFVFYTNLESRKGTEIRGNGRVALNFHWRALGKQVVVLGVASQVDDEEADEYFATRPRGSQLGAWASQQSRPLASRAHLVAAVAKLEARWLGRPIPRPPHWSGFRVAPHWIEFWVAGRFRLHDRIAYEPTDEGWRSMRLNP
ncbi:MAG TPA: pyridoxamine 5'-phosphate oxidase [Thermoanaerobaculia bacterium]|nr:pyridoxamine 5'-phosphate oxidase [Thermoanaerobaculia bacterium]